MAQSSRQRARASKVSTGALALLALCPGVLRCRRKTDTFFGTSFAALPPERSWTAPPPERSGGGRRSFWLAGAVFGVFLDGRPTASAYFKEPDEVKLGGPTFGGDRFDAIETGTPDRFGVGNLTIYSQQMSSNAAGMMQKKKERVIKAWKAAEDGINIKLAAAKPNWMDAGGFLGSRMANVKQPMLMLNSELLGGKLSEGASLKDLSQVSQDFFAAMQEVSKSLERKDRDRATAYVSKASILFSGWLGRVDGMIDDL